MSNSIKRIIAGVIDHFIACLISSILVFIVTLGKTDTTLFTVTLYLLPYFVLMLIKDYAQKNASVGKRFFGIKVVKTDGTKLKITDYLMRTIPCVILLPLEIFLLIFNDKRIGDMWSKTAVVSNDVQHR